MRKVREEGDLGGKKNPMANNMLEAYAFFAFYEAVDHSFTAEDLNALIDAAMGKSIRMLSHCIELNPAFCDSDDAKYGNLHKNLKWARTGTIGKGASCCDFRIIDISRCPDYKD